MALDYCRMLYIKAQASNKSVCIGLSLSKGEDWLTVSLTSRTRDDAGGLLSLSFSLVVSHALSLQSAVTCLLVNISVIHDNKHLVIISMCYIM